MTAAVEVGVMAVGEHPARSVSADRVDSLRVSSERSKDGPRLRVVAGLVFATRLAVAEARAQSARRCRHLICSGGRAGSFARRVSKVAVSVAVLAAGLVV